MTYSSEQLEAAARENGNYGPCAMCGKPDAYDFQMECKVIDVTKNKPICGNCKIEFGKGVEEQMIKWLKKRIK